MKYAEQHLPGCDFGYEYSPEIFMDTELDFAAEICEGGDAYPVGVREMARTLVADCEARQLSLQAILHRSGNVH